MSHVDDISISQEKFSTLEKLLRDSGTLALRKDWANACIAAMQANQIFSRMIRDASIRDLAQTRSMLILKERLAELEGKMAHADAIKTSQV